MLISCRDLFDSKYKGLRICEPIELPVILTVDIHLSLAASVVTAITDFDSSSMSLIYVDEAGGSDTTGDGSLEKPYQSLAQGVYAHSQAVFRIRKTVDAEYEEPTPTSLKKAKKNAQGIEKKKKKDEEKAERDAEKQREENEKHEQLLEESKKIILQEDPALPTATRVSNRLLFRITGMKGYRLKSFT